MTVKVETAPENLHYADFVHAHTKYLAAGERVRTLLSVCMCENDDYHLFSRKSVKSVKLAMFRRACACGLTAKIL